jgi:hypothetical protein
MPYGVSSQVLALCQRHGLPFEALSLMGGGVMEWRRDRERHCNLQSGFVVDRVLPGAAPGQPRTACAADLLHLAASLLRQYLPPTHCIKVIA